LEYLVPPLSLTDKLGLDELESGETGLAGERLFDISATCLFFVVGTMSD